MSKVGENSIVAEGEPKELAEFVPPTFAEDLAPNVKVGFESMCEFIKQSHAPLTAKIAKLSTRIDALGDVLAAAPVPPLPAAPHPDMVQR